MRDWKVELPERIREREVNMHINKKILVFKITLKDNCLKLLKWIAICIGLIRYTQVKYKKAISQQSGREIEVYSSKVLQMHEVV